MTKKEDNKEISKTVKRELWKTKKGNFYYVVARENGKQITRKRWNQKDNVPKLKRIFKKNKTFDKNVIRTTGDKWKTIEYQDLSDKPSIPSKSFFQYVVKGTLKDGSILTARSSQKQKGIVSIKVLQEEARVSFFERLDQKFTGGYDEDEGRRIADRQLTHLREGVVYYKTKGVS